VSFYLLCIVSKKQSKKAAKKAANKGHIEDTSPRISIDEQTIDLPLGDGTEAGVREAFTASRELTKALRAKRRAAIRESNFLKTM
jgi:large subunit ribosomal protein L54